MSKWNNEQLENMLEDVVNELDLSDAMIHEHGQNGTTPAELVRLILDQKDRQMTMLKLEMKQIENSDVKVCNHFILKEYLTQSYGTCSICGAFVTGL